MAPCAGYENPPLNLPFKHVKLFSPFFALFSPFFAFFSPFLILP